MPLSRPFAATPGNLWRRGFKPWPPHTAELDPNGQLSKGLQTCILFDQCLKGGSIVDLAAPTQRFTVNGTTATRTASPWGGGCLNFDGSTIDTDYLQLNTALASTSAWTASWHALFNGSSTGAGVDTIFASAGGYNSAAGSGLIIPNFNHQYSNVQVSFSLTPALTSITGWQRHTFTADGSTVWFYQNGILQSSASGSITLALAWILDGWEFPTSDFFFWNRTLTQADVATHAADPYGTTLRPKLDEWTIRGTPAVGVVKKQGLLTTGVGP